MMISCQSSDGPQIFDGTHFFENSNGYVHHNLSGFCPITCRPVIFIGFFMISEMLFLKYLNGLQFFPPSLLFSTILILYLTWIYVILNHSFVQSIRLKRPKSWTYGDIFLSQISQIQSSDFHSRAILKLLLYSLIASLRNESMVQKF